jgi:hypothetical protein
VSINIKMQFFFKLHITVLIFGLFPWELQDGQLRNCGSISDRSGYSYLLQRVQAGSGGPPSLLFEWLRGSLPGVERPYCKANQSNLMPNVRMSGIIHPFIHMLSWRVQE